MKPRKQNRVIFAATGIVLTCAACDDPDAVMSLAECSGEPQVYTARGFAERMRKDHGIKVCEFLDAETAAAVLFGIDHLKAAG